MRSMERVLLRLPSLRSVQKSQNFYPSRSVQGERLKGVVILPVIWANNYIADAYNKKIKGSILLRCF